jgi:endonuclease YncB( thermonuclease family)
MTAWHFPGATLDHVVDGDTFHARVSSTIDFGFHVKSEMSSVQKFRLNRLNTAPLATPSGMEARAEVYALLSPGAFDLTSVGPYKFGDEWMAEVIVVGIGNLSDYLIVHGYAAPWDGSGKAPLPPWPRTVS